MKSMMSFLAGAFCGAAVGAVAALLLAPLSGQELRTRTRDGLHNLADDVRQAVAEKRTALEEQLTALKVKRPAPPATD